MENTKEFFIERAFHLDKLLLHCHIFDRNQREISIATDVVFEKYETDKFQAVVPNQPMLALSNEEAQQLIDELWRAGLRPTDGSGSAGAMAATQKHLEDMRKISFDLFRKVLMIANVEYPDAKE